MRLDCDDDERTFIGGIRALDGQINSDGYGSIASSLVRQCTIDAWFLRSGENRSDCDDSETLRVPGASLVSSTVTVTAMAIRQSTRLHAFSRLAM